MIEVSHLKKRYGNNLAVDDLSFKIDKGRIYGFLGPNGAGKSTTMNIMTGCLAATSGQVKINGFDIFENPVEAKRLIGYLPELPPLYLDRTPREYLTFVARAKGVAEDKVKEEIANAMQVTSIDAVADRICKNLSKGYKQRVGIAQAILGNPEVIILDEPTVGLDPLQIIEIRDLIKELGKTHTVILSSHILPEVQAVCQTIMIINKGKLVACDTPENLEKMFRGKLTLNLKVKTTKENANSIIANTNQFEDIKVVENNDGTCSLEAKALSNNENELMEMVFKSFNEKNISILQMNLDKASLEDIFIELTEGGNK